MPVRVAEVHRRFSGCSVWFICGTESVYHQNRAAPAVGTDAVVVLPFI